MTFQSGTCDASWRNSSPFNGGTPPRQGTQCLAAKPLIPDPPICHHPLPERGTFSTGAIAPATEDNRWGTRSWENNSLPSSHRIESGARGNPADDPKGWRPPMNCLGAGTNHKAHRYARRGSPELPANPQRNRIWFSRAGPLPPGLAFEKPWKLQTSPIQLL